MDPKGDLGTWQRPSLAPPALRRQFCRDAFGVVAWALFRITTAKTEVNPGRGVCKITYPHAYISQMNCICVHELDKSILD